MPRKTPPAWLTLLIGAAAGPRVSHSLKGPAFEICGLPPDFAPRAGKLLQAGALAQSIGSLDFYVVELPGPTVVELHVARPPVHRINVPCRVRGTVRPAP